MDPIPKFQVSNISNNSARHRLYYKELTKQSSSGIIEPAGAGVYIQTASEVADVSTMHLKNVTHKEISEVWINVNGKIIKTVK